MFIHDKTLVYCINHSMLEFARTTVYMANMNVWDRPSALEDVKELLRERIRFHTKKGKVESIGHWRGVIEMFDVSTKHDDPYSVYFNAGLNFYDHKFVPIKKHAICQALASLPLNQYIALCPRIQKRINTNAIKALSRLRRMAERLKRREAISAYKNTGNDDQAFPVYLINDDMYECAFEALTLLNLERLTLDHGKLRIFCLMKQHKAIQHKVFFRAVTWGQVVTMSDKVRAHSGLCLFKRGGQLFDHRLKAVNMESLPHVEVPLCAEYRGANGQGSEVLRCVHSC